jgi:hypothetical protein
VKGYTVITSDDKKAGHVVDQVGDNLIVEHGLIFKQRRPLPCAFAHADDGEQIVRTSVSSRTLDDAPDAADPSAVARHYGLVGNDPDPVTHGVGDVLPEDPSRPADDSAVAERARLREHMGEGEGRLDRGSSIGITGGDRFRDAGR